MDDKRCFVQFLHPGGEHKPDDDLVKGWNKTPHPHQRKFLKRVGSYVADGKPQKGEIVFWGEWEPESKAERIYNPINHEPQYIYEPYYVVPKSYGGLQNTDPFVFGEQFHYTWCQQRMKKGATQLRYLKEGSVILFGSCEDKNAFVLDTVFVVGCWIDHSRINYQCDLKRAISREYWEVAILPGYQKPSVGSICCSPEKQGCTAADSQKEWRLYFGAMYDNPVQGIYSFFPCQPYDAKSSGFARPRIRLPEITDNLNQGKRLNKQPNLDKITLLWGKVAEQVRDKHLALGVYAEMPVRCTDG